MGRVVNFVYGALIVFVALDALFLGFIPDSLLSYSVLVLGVLVLFTRIDSPKYGAYAQSPRPPFQWLRRWVFGAAMILMGLASAFGVLGEQLSSFTIYSTAGQFILLGIGAIYFFSAFARTRNIVIGSV